MSAADRTSSCTQTELVTALALGALPDAEARAIQDHLAVCVACREEFESLQRAVGLLPVWPASTLRANASLWDRLASRIGEGEAPRADTTSSGSLGEEGEWNEAAPGLHYKILSMDAERDRVSLLVRLAPGTDYPPHTHSGIEELHLLDGELWINERKLYPGDYSYAEADTADHRVWSETGCTCVLITSTRDRLS